MRKYGAASHLTCASATFAEASLLPSTALKQVVAWSWSCSILGCWWRAPGRNVLLRSLRGRLSQTGSVSDQPSTTEASDFSGQARIDDFASTGYGITSLDTDSLGILHRNNSDEHNTREHHHIPW